MNQDRKKLNPLRSYDSTDQELIAILRQDARTPVAKLATMLNVSRGTVQNRLDRLLKSGALLGFTIRVREEFESECVQAIMLIEVTGKSTSQVIRRLRGIAELTKMHTTNGSWDLVVRITATNLEEFDNVLRRVRETDGVLNSETSILLSSV